MSYPEYFQGFGVDKVENWNKPQKVTYKAKPFTEDDVDIEVECCGVCGSDIHTARGGWGPLKRNDLVVGHEVIGTVSKIGANVTQFKLGDRVGLGAQCNSCQKCHRCKNNDEQYCQTDDGSVGTYHFIDKGYVTQGGYASHVRAHQNFVFAIPKELKSEHAAPLMCGGLTVYSPLVRNGCKPGTNVGVVGIGGLGHMAIMIAKALGANVTAISRSSSKKEESLKMGADSFIATGEDKNWVEENQDKFDLILNCASSLTDLNINGLLSISKVQGRLVSVGLPEIDQTMTISPFVFVGSASSLSTAKLGSKKEAIELLDLCVKHNIKPWVEEIKVSEDGCNKALTRCYEGDVRYRFVLTDFKKAFSQ